MKTLRYRKQFTMTLLGMVACINTALADGLDHNDKMECYASVFIQCPTGDQGCLDWGYDECDGHYDNAKLDTNSFGILNNRNKLKLSGRQKANTAKIKRSISN